ncbi:MAG: tetratricopeptide repeat-containing sensor histidine kinase [Cyclobacteriaceae bacterium]|nr:tetratricopeptide repeat-containing sensor histidine kinase [Cyclobacteriaceae bacterium]
MTLWCLVLACVAPASAQDQKKIDSLRIELKEHGDRNRYKVLWELAYELFDGDNYEALEFAQMAHAYALKNGLDSMSIVQSGRLTGQLLRRVHKLEECIAILEKIRPIAARQGYDGELARILNTLALTHTFRAEYDKALEYHFQSLLLREKEGSQKNIGMAFHNIGLTYYKMGSFDLSVEYSLRALEVYRILEAKPDIVITLVNIGLSYNETSKFEAARSSFEEALDLCGVDCDDETIMQAEFGLGNAFYEQNYFGEANAHYRRSYELSVKEKDSRFIMENLLRLAKIALVQRNHGIAREYLDLAEKMPEKEAYREILKTYYQLEADYYSASSDYQRANTFLQKVNEVTDSIFSTDVIKNLTRVQTQYAQRENLAIIAAKDEVLALNERIIKQQQAVTVLLLIVVVLTTTLGIVIYRNYREIKAVNAELASAKQIIEDHNKFLDHLVEQKTKELVDSNESLVKVNDELDNFIYKTSHDIRGPLASLKGMVNLAIMDVKDEKALGYLGKLDLTAEKLNMILTRLLIVNRINHAELKPELIHFEPIIQEILTLEVKKGIPTKIKIDYEVAHDIHLISDKDMVRLILENLIDNAVKYYNDSERVDSFVRIVIGTENGRVTARVMDNGVGIAKMNRQKIFQMFVRASERSDTGGIGLYLAKLATEKLGGEINLISTDEKYTEFIVQFPDTMPRGNERRTEEIARQEKERKALASESTGNA